jgi:hypothetical protein
MPFLCNCQLFELSIFNTSATFALVAVDTIATPATLGPPLDEATYDTSECAKAALQSYARDNGDGISVMPSRDSRTVYGCAKDEDEADDEAIS